MKHNIYSVFDTKAGTYTPPFFQHAEPMAIRTFGDCCNDITHTFGKHPEDYTLFCLGTYDDLTGFIDQDAIKSVRTGLSLITTQESF